MNTLCDCHVHSHYSIDSSASIEALCQGALANGIGRIAVSDHYDLNPRDEGHNFFKPNPFTLEFENIRQQYADRLPILKGIEFGEPHSYPEQLEAVQEHDYDVILGSIHWVGEFFAGSKQVFQHYTPRQFYEAYYREMLAAIHQGKFDILAHIDFPKRYLKTSLIDLSILQEVLAALVEADIALEINTSSLRKGLPHSMPDLDVLGIYAQQGGSKITFGSDAHTAEDIGAGFEYALGLVEQFPTFQVGYVEQRRFIALKANVPGSPER